MGGVLSGACFALTIAMFFECSSSNCWAMILACGLWEAIHSLLDFAVDISIRCCKVCKFVVLIDVPWHVGKSQLHVFVPDHWGV